MVNIEVLWVRRNRKKGKPVREAIFRVAGYWEVTFCRDRLSGKPIEVSRTIPSTRINDPNQIGIPNDFYKDLMKQVHTVFSERGKAQSKPKQKSLFNKKEE